GGRHSPGLPGGAARGGAPWRPPAGRGARPAGHDHQVDPRRLLTALVAACGRAGVLLHRAEAVELLVEDGRATGARLSTDETVTADQVVLAAGPHSHRLPGLPEGVLPAIRPVKGQVLRLHVPEAYRPFLSRNVRAVVRGRHLYLVPRENGELVVGATTEEQGYDTTVTAGGVYELLRDAHELVPGITELPLRETSAGLRPGSPDNAPLLGPTPLPGLVASTGHYRNGVLLTPVTADLVSEYLVTGEVPELARPFTPTRFSSESPVAKASA
ncbi:FAD-dependent oxidoreductase, partial [Kitasatospora sp. NPDC056789]|uniref:FAD-dependent oxidoreductase n=1 Tax=Kitasatospora sp. NPDC056789 TaxID=3345945 RepID=UPI0036B4D7E6